jgi:hypothetical protein
MEETQDYRPVSRLAVAALVVGCCSGLALLSPVCWAIPVVGIAIAVAAWADVGRAAARKAGGLAAVAGLALSVGFGAQALGSAVVDRWIAGGRAEATALAWIDAVRSDRLADALALGETGPATLAVQDGEQATAGLAAQPLVKAIRACDAMAKIGAVTTGADDRGGEGWLVRGTLRPCGEHPGGAVGFRILVAPHTVRRHRGLVERWSVTTFDLDR